MADNIRGWIKIQRDFGSLEGRAGIQGRTFQVQHLRKNNPRQQYTLRANCVEGSFAEKDLGCWWTQLTIMYPLTKANTILAFTVMCIAPTCSSMEIDQQRVTKVTDTETSDT